MSQIRLPASLAISARERLGRFPNNGTEMLRLRDQRCWIEVEGSHLTIRALGDHDTIVEVCRNDTSAREYFGHAVQQHGVKYLGHLLAAGRHTGLHLSLQRWRQHVDLRLLQRSRIGCFDAAGCHYRSSECQSDD